MRVLSSWPWRAHGTPRGPAGGGGRAPPGGGRGGVAPGGAGAPRPPEGARDAGGQLALLADGALVADTADFGDAGDVAVFADGAVFAVAADAAVLAEADVLADAGDAEVVSLTAVASGDAGSAVSAPALRVTAGLGLGVVVSANATAVPVRTASPSAPEIVHAAVVFEIVMVLFLSSFPARCGGCSAGGGSAGRVARLRGVAGRVAPPAAGPQVE